MENSCKPFMQVSIVVCIPRKNLETYLRRGSARMVNRRQEMQHAATFAYFDPGQSTLHQHAPTFICGDMAAEVLKIENDPTTGGTRILKFRMLSAPRGSAPD